MKSRYIISHLFLICSMPALSRELIRPPLLAPSELVEFAELTPERQAIIIRSLALRQKHGWLKYTFGSASPDKGGFDCSGAIYFLLRDLGYEPPRTSSAQFDWIEKASTLHPIPATARKLSSPAFHMIQPADLVFWSGTYVPSDGRTNGITHVGIYLGTEKKDGHPVMICSSRGRSYRRIGRDGYGVFDFRIPSAKSKTRLVGYGKPPARKEMKN